MSDSTPNPERVRVDPDDAPAPDDGGFDRACLERRIREETFGDHGIEDVEG